jgi:hypothetical protein
MAKDGVKKTKIEGNVKTYDFLAEEQDFLQPRQLQINQFKLIVNDIDFAIQQFIIRSVVPRLGITDPEKKMITYNVAENKLIVADRPPEIVKPDNKIYVPGKN